MKTKKEIIAFKRACEKIRKDAEEAGLFTGSMAVRGFLDALDWVLMPSGELTSVEKKKIWKDIEKKVKGRHNKRLTEQKNGNINKIRKKKKGS